MTAILVLRLSSLGDIVLTSSFLQSCAEHFPHTRLDFVVRDDFVALASALPGVQRVIGVSRRAGPAHLAALAVTLAREPYTHVFDLHHSLRSRLLTWKLARRRRSGFSKQELARFVLVHAHRDIYHRCGGARPLRDRMLDPLRRLGLEPRLHDTRLVPSAAARARAAALLAEVGTDAPHRWIALAPGARWPSKRWPTERFAALLAQLGTRPVHRFVLLGAATERAAAAQVARAAPAVTRDLCGQLDIVETAAVLEQCRLFVGNDSGLLHVAEAMGCPVLGFFGPTTPAFGYVPYRPASRFLHQPPPCNPCSKNGSRPCHRPTHECMENLSVAMAEAAAAAILGARP